MTKVQEIESAVQTLSEDEYGLFRDWLSEFEQKKETFPLHPEWKDELRRRIDDVESEVTKGIPAEQVMAEAKARLRR